MKANRCTNCKHCKSVYSHGVIFRVDDNFRLTCLLLDGDEITPILMNFISTCGCASWEQSE